MEFLTEYRISERYARRRIDQFLSFRYGYLSRTEWQKEIRRGKIYYNGAVLTRYDRKTKAGDVLSYSGRDAAEPEVDRNYSIIYEDEFLLGVNKPGNLPVHPAGIFYHNTLLTILERDYGTKLHLLHRLDRETSGVVVLAKNSDISVRIHRDFASVKKKYLALVHGMPELDEFVIDLPVDHDKDSGVEHKRVARAGGRDEACTSFTRLLSFNNYSLMKAAPVTGRQHQIRVHLKYAGHPIVGDKLYGNDESAWDEFITNGPSDRLTKRLGFRRSALHSRSISFYHPVMKRRMCLRAPFPEDMRQFIREGNGDNG
ncbi:MAG: RluA family pseudouridine synthase [Spirochaetes bacterium]|nr:RluA family pseudouridine synthase [Spirochaetota bacterium]